ncbi:hypothetical protein [Lacticaseibacillus thailandensis]|uniref:Uncharacterized protein n=1 Tax=Lacticaseibacillus thailandensis DSM 22698 = JCM 13996 TaxID=1423810 RepID=A0A0R2CFU4_9LACO|nr:hypothetical protein [Lacticaseibacillus thailandensis]KRM87227.1 hypothetical protein FD19_GL001383 [Lacticaseibacillus thailandensis DSM 22698 = JCM 13996]
MGRMQRKQEQQQRRRTGPVTRRRGRTTAPVAQKRHHPGRWVAAILAIVIAVVVLCVVFFTPINNTVRTATGGNDTVADKAVKSVVVSKLDSAKTGNSTVDGAIDQVANTIKTTRVSTVMQAAKSESALAALLTSKGMDSAQANTAANAIYSTSALDGVRAQIAQGNWYGVYRQAQQLAASQGVDLSSVESALAQ